MALEILLGTPTGWLSLFTLAFMIGMAVFLLWFFNKKSKGPQS